MKLLLAFALSLAAAAAAAAQAPSEYRSNAMGMKLEPLPPGESAVAGYVLRVTEGAGNREDVLLQDGAEVRRTLRVGRADGGTSETVYEAGAVSASRSYDIKGRLIEERGSDEIRRYVYRGEQLAATEASTGDGAPLYSERYGYARNGLLRAAERKYADGRLSLSTFLFVEGRLESDRLQSAGRVLNASYDAAGRLVAESERNGGVLEWERTRSYDPASGRLAATTEQRSGSTLSTRYDEGGRVVEEARTGTEPYRAAFTYDSEGRRTRLRRVGASGTEEWRIEYDADGHQQESYLARGQLQRVRRYSGERAWVDTLYKDGAPVLRVTYRDEQKVAEEPLR